MAERPDRFEGVITIEWTNPQEGAPMAGWRFLPRLQDGTPVYWVLEMTLHVAAKDGVWAECLMLADDKGRPIFGGGEMTKVYQDPNGDGLTKGTFSFLVAAMTVKPS